MEPLIEGVAVAAAGEPSGRPSVEEQTWLADELGVRLRPELWRLERWGSASLALQAGGLGDHLAGCLVAEQDSVLATSGEVASRCELVWLMVVLVVALVGLEPGLVGGQVLELG